MTDASPSKTSELVSRQYDAFPYPTRDPEDERHRLMRTNLDDLAAINHYCFGGQRDFRDNFRVLVAGGGTGDALIFLAHQLRETNASIVYLDLSETATNMARARVLPQSIPMSAVAGLTCAPRRSPGSGW